MTGVPKWDYPPDEELIELLARFGGSVHGTAKHLNIPRSTLQHHVDNRKNIRAAVEQQRGSAQIGPVETAAPTSAVHEALKRKRVSERVSVPELADELNVAPKVVRAALDDLRAQGYRVPEEHEDGGNIALERIRPDAPERLHKSLLEGQELEVGLVSDTHLASKEEALPELELAYDVFAERGIREVWHPGDLVAGVGIFRTQHAEIKCHTYEDQVEYAAEHYPRRDGVTTRLIGGNHDLEGDFGRIGGDPCRAVANQREDIEYLGPYSAHVELPGGAFAHLLHGSGGMGYAYSYKAQKLVDGYEAGRKPALLCVGHWHVAGWLLQRNVNVVFPGCFEWKSNYLKRKGLSPAVGFYILHLTIGDDGSLVRLRPEWHQFFEGRVVAP